jgi:hypothetical protein
MASTSGTFSSYPSLLTYIIGADEVATNIATNTSTVRVKAYVQFTGSSASSYSVSGSTSAGNWNYGFMSFSGAGTIEVFSTDITVAHATNGTGSYSFSGSATSGGWGSASTGTGTLTLTDFDRSAGTPASCSATVTGGVFTVAIGVSTSYITPFNYYTSYASSADGGTTYGSWSSESAAIPSTTSPLVKTYSGLTSGLTYKFRVRAYNGVDNYSAYRESSPVFLTAGGKRRTSVNTWVLTATAAKRRNAGNTANENLTKAKRFNGTAWVDLS